MLDSHIFLICLSHFYTSLYSVCYDKIVPNKWCPLNANMNAYQHCQGRKEDTLLESMIIGKLIMHAFQISSHQSPPQNIA